VPEAIQGLRAGLRIIVEELAQHIGSQGSSLYVDLGFWGA
jgi:hypothetical protein